MANRANYGVLPVPGMGITAGASARGGHAVKKIKVKKVEKILATATAIEY